MAPPRVPDDLDAFCGIAAAVGASISIVLGGAVLWLTWASWWPLMFGWL